MTCSAVDAAELGRVRRRIFIALFTALAIALHAVEVLLPSPLPWLRFGFGNILTVVVLLLFDNRAAWAVTLGRIGVGSLLLGRLFSPGFFLSLAGGAVAVALMTSARTLCGRRIGPVGVSVLGAGGHVLGQLLVAWLLLVRHDGVWHLLPFLLVLALGTGLVNGIAADLLLEVLRPHPAFQHSSGNGPSDAAS